MRETFTPMLEATSALWITAVTTFPCRVRLSTHQVASPHSTAMPISITS